MSISTRTLSTKLLPSSTKLPRRILHPFPSLSLSLSISHILPSPSPARPKPKPQPQRPCPLPTLTRPLTTTAHLRSLSPPATSATPLSPTAYHTLSDTYIDSLVSQLEEIQEARADVDVEYSAGVLTLHFPPHGTYVLNKQPPNRQIWLSSPVSGPKRFDWVAIEDPDTDPARDKEAKAGGEEKEGRGGRGQWVYLRDGSTLSGLLEREVGVVVVGEGEGEGE